MTADTQVATREQVVAEALSWIGTPYRLRQCLKGVGADCATFILGVYHNCGIIGEEDLGIYKGDWYLHASDERYMLRILRHAHKICEATCSRNLKMLSGNIILVRAGASRVYNHGAIIVSWPKIIHCVPPQTCQVNSDADPVWAFKNIAVFDPWAKAGKV